MFAKAQRDLPVLSLLLFSSLFAHAQIRPDVTRQPKKAPPPKPAQILIQTSPNAEVYLDEQFAGRASSEGRLTVGHATPGDHQLRISLTGKKDYDQQVTVAVGEVVRVRANLADLAGSIRVRTLAGAEVFLDNSSRGTADTTGELVIPDVSRGSHILRVTKEGKKEFRQSIAVLAGQESMIDALMADTGPTLGGVRENPKDRLKYVWIPPGAFMMGFSPGDTQYFSFEMPPHQVSITKGFWIGQTEVTVGAYMRFAAATGRQMPPPPFFNNGWANAGMPIVNVSWEDAHAYCTWADGRLPTEAEWEYAARGGSTEAQYGNLEEIAWYNMNSVGQAHEVALKRANGFGLYDVLGNVWEWVNDWWDENYYQNSPSQDPPGPASGQMRVLRGGSWNVVPRNVRVSSRHRGSPGDGDYGVGFRCAAEVVNP